MIMRYFLAVILVFIGSPMFAIDAHTVCKVVSSVRWQSEKTEKWPKGFSETPADEIPSDPIKMTISEQVIAVSQGSFPSIWTVEAIDTFGPFKVGGDPEIQSVRYMRKDEHPAFFEKLIYKDPMCKDQYKSDLAYTFTSIDTITISKMKCDCLSDIFVDLFVED